MKKLMTLALMALIAGGAQAETKKDSVNKNKPVFTVIKENKITSIKDQYVLGLLYPVVLRG